MQKEYQALTTIKVKKKHPLGAVAQILLLSIYQASLNRFGANLSRIFGENTSFIHTRGMQKEYQALTTIKVKKRSTHWVLWLKFYS